MASKGRRSSPTVLRGTPTPRPLQFNRIHVLDLAVVPQNWPPDNDAPWATVSARGLSNATSAIWPGALRIGRARLFGRFAVLAWAWIIIIGALMITPGGVSRIACGPGLTNGFGVVSIVLGALGLASRAVASPAALRTVAPAQVQAKGNLHG